MKFKSLQQETHKLLIVHAETVKLTSIAKASGLPIGWLKSFKKRGSENDSISDRVQKLYEHLTGKKLL